MADITSLILADHHWFRAHFARLDYLQARASVRTDSLEAVWRPLADKLDVHAYIEEKFFYPQLLKRGVDDPEGETLDAIGDHNDIRDGVRDANAAEIGTDEWWAAVGRAREATVSPVRGSRTVNSGLHACTATRTQLIDTGHWGRPASWVSRSSDRSADAGELATRAAGRP